MWFALFAAWIMLVSCLAYSSPLKMKAVCSSEMFVDFHWIARCFVPEDGTLYNHHSENFKFKIRDIYLYFIGSDKYIKKTVIMRTELGQLSCVKLQMPHK
jgi:hypothetical protein